MDLATLLTTENVGGWDRWLRALLGSAAITVLAMEWVAKDTLAGYLLALIAFTGLFTALTSHCTPYTLLGISTKSDKKTCK